MSKCLWSGWKWQWEVKKMPSPFLCSHVICEWSWQKTLTEKKNVGEHAHRESTKNNIFSSRGYMKNIENLLLVMFLKVTIISKNEIYWENYKVNYLNFSQIHASKSGIPQGFHTVSLNSLKIQIKSLKAFWFNYDRMENKNPICRENE